MNEKYKQNILICCISLLLLICIGLNSKLYASVSSEMYAINTIDSLEQYYNESNEYKQRYILKYLTGWLEAKEFECAPECILSMIEDGLYANDGLVIREAVILAGKYGISDYADRLVELYKNAEKMYSADGVHIKNAVIYAFQLIGGDSAKNAISQFLPHTPRYVLESEFSSLLKAVADFGDTLLIDELDSIEVYIKNKISTIDPNDDPGRSIYQYEAVLQLVYHAKEEIISRGGE